jgi:predicted cation transporter
MELFVWLIGVVVAAVVSYFVNELLVRLIKNPKRIYRYGIVVGAFVLAFIAVALVASPKTRDTARAILANSDDRRCYFNLSSG